MKSSTVDPEAQALSTGRRRGLLVHDQAFGAKVPHPTIKMALDFLAIGPQDDPVVGVGEEYNTFG